jgi:hypothetical protein
MNALHETTTALTRNTSASSLRPATSPGAGVPTPSARSRQAVYAPIARARLSGGYLPQKVRVFLDFVGAEMVACGWA